MVFRSTPNGQITSYSMTRVARISELLFENTSCEEGLPTIPLKQSRGNQLSYFRG